MEESREEVQETQEAQESPETSESKDDEGTGFDFKAALPIFLTMIAIIILFFKIVIPALVPADHSPSMVIEETQDGEYYDNFVDRFK